MNYAISKARLKDYFSTITYIDDTFDCCIVDEPIDYGEEEIDEAPPLPLYALGNAPEEAPPVVVPTEEKNMEANLTAILTALNNEKYAGIRFNPVVFNSDLNKDLLVKKIQETPLTLIDWDLGSTDKAFDIINRLFEKTKQLKVIVVYTSNFVEAVKALGEDQKLQFCEEIRTTHINFNCYRCNSQSLLIIAAKQKYNLSAILDVIPDVFINNCGLMPVALLDYMASTQDLTDELFGAFCHPFEDIYWLQMYFSEINEADIPDAIVAFFQNKFREYCTIAPEITEELFNYQKNRFKAVVEQDDETVKTSIATCWAALRPHLSEINREFCDAICTVEYSEFKACSTLAIEKGTTWSNFLGQFDPILSCSRKKVAANQCEALFAPYAKITIPEDEKVALEEHQKSIQKNFLKENADSYKEFKNQIFPIFIQSLISSIDLLFSGRELVKNLKYKKYSSHSLNDLLQAGKELSKSKKSAFLMNKLHFGDVLLRKNGDSNEYLLCITPPCDVFRPDKIKLNINFIRGEELKIDDLNSRRKENVHVSILPISEDGTEKLKYVCWQLYGIVNFDMSQEEDYEKLCSYSRPFMMSEQYARQIANAFTAYFSRAGVDELFMKAAGNLQTIFS